MRVDDDVRRFDLELERLRLVAEQLLKELLEEITTLGHALRARQLQLAVVLREHGVTGGFQEQEGRAIHVLIQQRQVVAA